jgi:dephospho-CoA kinase
LNAPRRTVRIGLTGPIGCGKSTVAAWLAEQGVRVVDADELARDVTGPGQPALAAVIERFGRAVLHSDGSLDRHRLAAIVFADADALAALESIVHPAVRPRILAAIQSAQAAGAPAVAVEAIRLVETGLAAVCDEVWLVACEPAEQRKRIAGRGMDGADAARRIDAQQGIVDHLRPHATRVIDTSGAVAETRAGVEAALRDALA